jgi:hypothetical protein
MNKDLKEDHLRIKDVENIDKILKNRPGIKCIYFDEDDTLAERNKKIKKNDVPALNYVLKKMVSDFAEYVEDKPPIYYMPTEIGDMDMDEMDGIEDRYISDNLRLIKIYNNHGIIYDFNGWPCDREEGYLFYESKDRKNIFFDIASNYDTILTTMCDDIDIELLKLYQSYRKNVK